MKNFFRSFQLLAVLLSALFLAGCGEENQTLPPLPLPPKEISDGKIEVDCYFDATVSMQGFTTLAAGNFYRTLPDLLDEMGNSMGSIKFFSFGERIRPLEGRSYRQFTSPEVYVEKITSVANVVDKADPYHLSIIVTDLFESEADWSNVVQKIREKFFSNHLSVGVIGIKNSFSGKIFDVGLNAAAFDYNSYDYPQRFRPFYLFVLGNESAVKDFMEKFNDRQTLPNEVQYLLLSENLSAVSNKTSEQNILEMENLFREEKFSAPAEVRELGIENFNEPATFTVQFKRESPLGACPFDFDLKSGATIFALENGEWQPLPEGEMNLEVNPIDGEENSFTCKLTFTPENFLKQGTVNFVRVSVAPLAKSYRLPEWVAAWSMADVDISPRNFDGTKTVNLTRILGSLKDSLYSTEPPNLINLNFIFYEG